VAAEDVAFSYAGSASKGGAASNLDCTGCVAPSEVSPGANGQVLTTSAGAAAWQAPAGDISSVNTAADSGLQGGGVSGDVSLSIKPGAVSNMMLAANAVTADKIAPDAVEESEIADEAVHAQHLYGGAVTSTKIADGAVITQKLADGAVTVLKLANNAVTTAKVSTAGGSSGQVLTHNGSSVVWANAALHLPFSDSASGADAFSVTNSGSGRAVRGVADSDTAIWGQTTSGLAGVDGWNASDGNCGTRGRTSAHSGYGVCGVFSETNKRGYLGTFDGAVVGKENTYTDEGRLASSGVGVYGIQGTGQKAGFFVGDVDIHGTLTKTGGSFKIDHPLDPANRTLSHSFVESPDMLNVYNGNAETGADGFATVELPGYFEALNRDYRYQLTVIGNGERWAQARIAREIRGNAFVIQTSAPHTRVSWQVTGIRQDAWANANRIAVEQDKPEAERGLYLHPEVIGLPDELSVTRLRSPEPGEQARLAAK
jgi:hypothetical protein